MKTIYNAVIEQLRPLLDNNTIRWIDWDKGQLKKTGKEERPDVAYPCALIRIGILSTTNITDSVQDCKAAVTITLAFDPLAIGRTAANAPDEVRQQGLEPYDAITEVYASLQGYSTANFSPLYRRSASEMSHDKLFVYQIVFDVEFEDRTADR